MIGIRADAELRGDSRGHARCNSVCPMQHARLQWALWMALVIVACVLALVGLPFIEGIHVVGIVVVGMTLGAFGAMALGAYGSEEDSAAPGGV